jgi:DNA-binding protein HU-beta
MNRAELISQIAEMTGHSKVDVGMTLTAMIHSITGAVYKGERVTLVGFGTFERRNRQARTGRNPRTLAPLKIAGAKVPAFRAGPELKDVVDGRAKLKTWSMPVASKSAPAKKASPKKAAPKAKPKAKAKSKRK